MTEEYRQTLSSMATHIGINGKYYRQKGKFWYVLQQEGWMVISGSPTVKIKPVK